jgi:GNAT superfamily N-acetyltransferase
MTSFSRAQALELQKHGLRDWVGLLGTSSPGARVHAPHGITASVVPACPQRSICNSVTYDDAPALAGAYDGLAAMYEEAGIEAWTVWVPGFDADAIDVLESAGHALDGEPMAMSLRLADFEAPDIGELDWDTRPDPADLGRINDIAYGLPLDSGLAPGLTVPGPGVTLYQARVDGETACVLGTMDHDDDLGFYFVATHPDSRGLGLASRLMTVALVDAVERGLETSSLQGSPMGQPVYRKLGYDDDFAMRMYERRLRSRSPKGEAEARRR